MSTVTRGLPLVAGASFALCAASLPAFAQTPHKIRFSAVVSNEDYCAEMMSRFAEALDEGFDYEGHGGG